MEELNSRVAEIDKAYADLMAERQNIVAHLQTARELLREDPTYDRRTSFALASPKGRRRIAEIDAEIIVIRKERGDCVEAGHQILADIKE